METEANDETIRIAEAAMAAAGDSLGVSREKALAETTI
jgi:hypothetical protein